MSRKFHVIRYLYGLYKGVTAPVGSSPRSRRLEIWAQEKASAREEDTRGEMERVSRAPVLSWACYAGCGSRGNKDGGVKKTIH